MKSSRKRPSRPPPAFFASKRYDSFALRRRESLGGKRYLLRWLKKPSAFFVLTALCLLVVPSLWFVSRTTAPVPVFMDGFDGSKTRNLRTSPRQEFGEPVVSPQLEGAPIAAPPPPAPPPSRAPPHITSRRPGTVLPPPPISPDPSTPAPQKSIIKRIRKEKHGEHQKSTVLPWKPTVLPEEVFRDVPPEECLPSPLWSKRVDASEYEFGCEDIYTMLTGEKQLVGSGFIRDVYLVEWEGRKLAVKFLREDYELRASEGAAESLHRWEEAALDAVRGHPNIAGLLGVCGASSVSEYYPTHLDDLIFGPGAAPLSITNVVSFALDAARGLQALHEAPGGPIVHYDIKPQQMMLDEDGRVKITDLNTVRFPDADVEGNSCPFAASATGVDSWRAPENIAGEKLTEKVDIYAMAMVFYSMLAMYAPYTNVQDGTSMIKNGIPPPTDPTWHEGFLEIVRDMWRRDPKARPSAGRVVQRLEILQRQLAVEMA